MDPSTICTGPLAACQTTPATRSRQARTETHTALALTAAAGLLCTSLPAAALDGCLVLLCLAAPSWRAIPQCVPPITQLWRDLARGKAFPSCGMAGGANAASHAWAIAPSYCPPQYTRAVEVQSGTRYTCDYAGAVSVTVNGQAFARTWWNFDGGAVTEFSATAKAQFGTWDTRFDDDYAAWLSAQPMMPPADAGN